MWSFSIFMKVFRIQGCHHKIDTAKVRTLSKQGGGCLWRMAAVPTSLVGENDIAGREKVITGQKRHCWEKNVLCSKWPNSSRKSIKKIFQKIHLLRRPNLTRGEGGLGGWDNVRTLAVFFYGAPKNLQVFLPDQKFKNHINLKQL